MPRRRRELGFVFGHKLPKPIGERGEGNLLHACINPDGRKFPPVEISRSMKGWRKNYLRTFAADIDSGIAFGVKLPQAPGIGEE
jgi:hypothetical protein